MKLIDVMMLTTTWVVPANAGPAPEAVVQAMFDAFNRHDAAAMAELYAEDARLASSDFCTPRVGREEVRRTYRELFAQFPDIHDEVQQLVVQGDRVAVRFVATSKLSNPPLALPIATLLTVRSGLIHADDSSFDTQGRACSS
jgi:hypothetical protein